VISRFVLETSYLISSQDWHTLNVLMPKKNRTTLSPAVKPVAKAILKAGLNLYDAAEEHVTEARDQLRDLITEVRGEMNRGVKGKAAKKTSSQQRRTRK
jgi:hypothetical protein